MVVTDRLFALDPEREARQHRPPVHEHGAGAAFAQLAAVLGARELQVFAQHLEQRLRWIDERVHALAIHGQDDPGLRAGLRQESASSQPPV